VEKSIGFLRRVSGHTFDTIYDLVFTSERVIACIIEHPGDVQRKYGMTELIMGSQLGKHGERLEKRRIADERRRLYEEKGLEGLDELKGLHRLNFEIHVREIASIEIRRGLLESSIKFFLSGDSKPGRTIRFRLKRNQVEEARKLADETLSSKSGDQP
jgi:hypothetical protein